MNPDPAKSVAKLEFKMWLEGKWLNACPENHFHIAIKSSLCSFPIDYCRMHLALHKPSAAQGMEKTLLTLTSSYFDSYFFGLLYFLPWIYPILLFECNLYKTRCQLFPNVVILVELRLILIFCAYFLLFWPIKIHDSYCLLSFPVFLIVLHGH